MDILHCCVFILLGLFFDMQTNCCALIPCYLFHDVSVGNTSTRGLLTWSGAEYCDIPEDPDQDPGYLSVGEPIIEYPDTDSEVCETESEVYLNDGWESHPGVHESYIELYPGVFTPELHRIHEA